MSPAATRRTASISSLARGRLDQVAGGARLDRLEDVVLLARRRQDQHPGGRVLAAAPRAVTSTPWAPGSAGRGRRPAGRRRGTGRSPRCRGGGRRRRRARPPARSRSTASRHIGWSSTTITRSGSALMRSDPSGSAGRGGTGRDGAAAARRRRRGSTVVERRRSTSDRPADVALVARARRRPSVGRSASSGPYAASRERRPDGTRHRAPARCRRTPRRGARCPSVSSWTTARPLSRERVGEVGVRVEQGQHLGRLAERDHQRGHGQPGPVAPVAGGPQGHPAAEPAAQPATGSGSGSANGCAGVDRHRRRPSASRGTTSSHSVPNAPVLSVAVPPRSRHPARGSTR